MQHASRRTCGQADTGTPRAPDTDADPDADTSADTDSDMDTDTDTDTDTDADPAPPPEIVRFIAMGDGGEGNADQYAVAATVKSVCDAKDDEHGPGCDFVLYLGDNFYDDVEGVDDEQFQTKFELPYADLDLPFWVVLGNHDYGVCRSGSGRASTRWTTSHSDMDDARRVLHVHRGACAVLRPIPTA